MSSERNEMVLSLSGSPRSNIPGLGIRLVEGSLTVSTSKFGSMSIYSKVQYGDQVWKSPISSRTGMKPKWNAYHLFEICPSTTIEIALYDKGLLFSDAEVGRCKLQISEISQGHQTEWWSVSNANSQVVGSVLVTFDLPHEDSALLTTHSSHNSIEIRDEYFKQLAEIELEKECLHSQWTNYKREKGKNKSGLHEESMEKLRTELAQENNRLREKETSLKVLFEQAKKENAKLKKAKAELKRCRENLKRREQSLQMEEAAIQQEKMKLTKEREEIQAIKSQLHHDSAKLKQERQKLTSEKREIENISKELGQTSKKIAREKILLKKSSFATRQSQDLIEDESLKIVYEDSEGKLEDKALKIEEERFVKSALGTKRDCPSPGIQKAIGSLSARKFQDSSLNFDKLNDY